MTADNAIPVRRLAILGAGAPRRDENAYARAARRLGVESRVFDVLGWRHRIELREGIAATYQWFLEQSSAVTGELAPRGAHKNRMAGQSLNPVMGR